MTRINSNVPSLIAQNRLARSNNDLNTALARLSTGLRINTGRDDPAGLIASESLRSDIVSVERAITNSERANQLIATADSALGQVSSLLNDIRGLVSDSANTGALSDEQIEANQLQLDSSLEAIDRIAQITQFQGRRLLDGSLDFITSKVSSSIQDLRIDQANFGTQQSIGVSVDVVKQASRGQLNFALGAVAQDVVLEVGGARGAEAFNFAGGSTINEIAAAVNLVSDATGVKATVQSEATKGSAVISSFGGNNDIVLTANDAGQAAGDVRIKYTLGNSSATTATYSAASGSDPATINVALQTSAYTAASVLVDDTNADGNGLVITSKIKGADFNDIKVVVTTTGTAGAETIVFDRDAKTLTIDVNAASTLLQVKSAFSAAANADIKELFSADYAEASSTGAAVFSNGIVAGDGFKFSGGTNGGAIVATANDVIAKINGAQSVVTASLAEGNNGYGVVTAFQEFAYSGSASANNRLQFLGPENSANIRFVSNPGQALSVDTTSSPPVKDFSSVVLQQDAADSAIKIRAKQKGSEWDGWTISIKDNADVIEANDNEFAVLDKESKTLTIHIDSGNSTAQDIIDVINNDEYVSQFFQASNFGSSDGSAVYTTATPLSGTTAGGLTSPGTLIVNLATNAAGIVTTTANDLIAFFNDSANAAQLSPFGISVTNAEGSNGSGLLTATTSDISFATSGTKLEDAQAKGTTTAVNGKNARIEFTAVLSGALYDGVKVVFEDDGSVTAAEGNQRGEYDANSKTLTFYVEDGVTTADDILKLFDSNESVYDADLAALFSAANVGDGSGAVTISDEATLTGGVVDTGAEQGTALLGNSDLADVGLTFTSSEYGSAGFVSVKALSGSFEVRNGAGELATRNNGTDVVARINGIQAIGKGLKAAINTSGLDLSFTLDASAADGSNFQFAITGGGAQFQLGPDVVSNQQARLGIRAVSTATLGGVSGKLFELRSGGAKSLSNDVTGAARIIEEVIGQVTSLRGRLGAFQKTTLESNISSLNDALTNLSEAESSIRDADFAKESARLTRAQILVQAGTSVLAIANSNPQNALALLR